MSVGMWNLKRLPSSVFSKLNYALKENVRMASKKAAVNEKPKITKKGFFHRSESVVPDNYGKNLTADSAISDSTSNDSDSKKVMRRSSMICSEGFDKYAFDYRKKDAPSQSAGLELDVVANANEPIHNQASFVSDDNSSANLQTSKSGTIEHAVRKPILFKSISASPTSVKNAPLVFKRVPEETIPVNIPLSYKHVSKETIPVTKHPSFKVVINKSSATNIPLSFSSIPEETSWIDSSSKLSSNRSAPVKNSPFSYRQVADEPSSARSSPLPSKHVLEEKMVNRATSYNAPVQFASMRYNPSSVKQVPDNFVPERNTALSFKHVPRDISAQSVPVRNNSSMKQASDNFVPERNTPLFFKPKGISAQSIPVKNNPLSVKQVSDNFSPERSTPLSFKNVPKDISAESAPVRNNHPSVNQVSDNFSPERNAPLSFKHVTKDISAQSASVRYNPPSIQDSDSFVPERNSPLSFKQVPKDISVQSAPVRNDHIKQVSDNLVLERNTPLSFKYASKEDVLREYKPFQTAEESIPHRNQPLSLKYVSGENMRLRNTNISAHFSETAISPVKDMSSFQLVPEETIPAKYSPLSYKNIPDEPIPVRNFPLSLKPILTKHMSLLKRNPSIKSNIIKRDSVVHPGRIDMQSSLCIDGRFQNPWPTWRPPTFTNILKFGVTRNKSKVPPKQELDLILPIVKQKFSKLTLPDDGIRVTWIGHSTVLIQMHGLNILTDPVFSDRASPSQVVGPKRYRDPPCTIHDLPHINAVVISHSHYDHLDYNTVTLLNARFGSEIRWFVPLGLQKWMEDVGCENIVELDWWEENCVPEHSDTFFIFTPAQHWSKRTIGDDNKVLWGSWCILGPKYKFFFAGDTGYCDVFKQIGRVHGPFDLSAIPIGAYEPRWFMKYQHINPEEAVKIHIDVKSKRSLAIHWGTFCLANEYYLDPPVKLREGLDKYEIPPELFFTMKHGESKLIAQNNLVKKYPLSDKNLNS